MQIMLEIKDALEAFYEKNDLWIQPVLKGLLCFLCCFTALQRIGAGGLLRFQFFALGMSILSAILPLSIMPLWPVALILLYLYTHSLVLFLVAFLVFLMTALMNAMLHGSHSGLILFIPLCFYLRIPFFAPVIAAYTFGLTALAPVALGSFLYIFYEYLCQNLTMDTGTELTAMAESISGLFLRLLSMRSSVLILLAMVLSFFLLVTLQSLNFRYARELGTVLGPIAAFSALLLWLKQPIPGYSSGGMAAALMLSLVLSLLYGFLFLAADYRSTEKVQFEDEDYFYYVKAIPKRKKKRR